MLDLVSFLRPFSSLMIPTCLCLILFVVDISSAFLLFSSSLISFQILHLLAYAHLPCLSLPLLCYAMLCYAILSYSIFPLISSLSALSQLPSHLFCSSPEIFLSSSPRSTSIQHHPIPSHPTPTQPNPPHPTPSVHVSLPISPFYSSMVSTQI